MQTLTDFFSHPYFVIIGGFTILLMIIYFIYTAYLVVRGVIPVLYRVGLGLSKRRIAIFASLEMYESIKSSLTNSGIFKDKNIIHIKLDNIDQAKEETIFLVDWETFNAKIEQVFSARKNHQVPLVIYAKPQGIPHESMGNIANRPNTVVVNFRGRLLNDILTSLITTSYKK